MPDETVGFGTKPDIVISPHSFDKEVFLKIGFFYDYLGIKPVLASLLDFRSLFFVVRNSISAKIKEISKKHFLGRKASEVLSLAETIGNLGKEVLTPEHSLGTIFLDSWTKEGKEGHRVLKEVSDSLKDEILHSGLAEFIKRRAEEDPDIVSFFLKKKPKKLSEEVLFALEESVGGEGSEWGFVLSWALNGGDFYSGPDSGDLIRALKKGFGPGNYNLDLEVIENEDVGGSYIETSSVAKIFIGAETIVKEKGIKVVFEHEYSFLIEIPVRIHFVLANYSNKSEVVFSEYKYRRNVKDKEGREVFYGLNENSKVVYYDRSLLALHDEEVDVLVETYDPDTASEYRDIFKKEKDENENRLLAVSFLSEDRVVSNVMSQLSFWKDKFSLMREVSGKSSKLVSYSSRVLKDFILQSLHLFSSKAVAGGEDTGACLNGERIEVLGDSEVVAFNNIELIKFFRQFYGENNPNMPKKGSSYNALSVSKEAIEKILGDSITIKNIFSKDSRVFLVFERSPYEEDGRYENVNLFLYTAKNPVVLVDDEMKPLDGSMGTQILLMKGGKTFYRYDFGKGARSVLLGKQMSFYKETR